jgi:putative ABC transport system permease protein
VADVKYWPLIWGGIWRKKVRAILVFLSIVNAFLLFGLLKGFEGGLAKAEAEAHADILIVQSKVSANELLPISLTSQIRGVPGVIAASPICAFFAYYQTPAQFVRAYGIDVDQVPEVTPAMEISPAALAAYRQDRTAAIVSDEVMRRYGWKVGDTIPLTSTNWDSPDGGRVWTFHVVGSFSAPSSVILRNSVQINGDYLINGRKNEPGMTNAFLVRVANPHQALQIGAAIDKLTANSPYETRSQSESQNAHDAVKGIGDVGLITNSIVGAMFFTLVFSIGAVVQQAVRDRTREIGVLKAIGFGDPLVMTLVLGEVALTCGLGALIGVGIADAAFPFAANVLGFSAIQPSGILASGLSLAILLALISGAPPAWYSLKLQIADALADR